LELNLLERPGLPVLVVGAGPTGLTLACALARHSVPVRIVEASPVPQPGSRGKGLQPRSLEVFDDLGIVEQVIGNGRADMPIRSHRPDGTVAPAALVAKQRPDIPYPASLITPEWRVEEALRARFESLGGGVEFGSTLETFEDRGDAVHAQISTEDGVETIDASIVVGCDGGHSRVRKLGGFSFEGVTLENTRMIVADLEVEGLDRDVWSMWEHADGFVALCPLPSTNLFQYQASLTPGQDASTTLANMQAILELRAKRGDIRLSAPAWSSLWRANVRLVDRYRSGRIFLAGDAAHIHSPAGGQGMNTGIQDSYNLGWKIAAVLQGAPAALLDTYERERRPVAESVISLSNQRMKVAFEGKGIPLDRDAYITQLGIQYRDSVLALDDRLEPMRLHAGDRAPDATGLMTQFARCRLFDLTRGEHFTLLDFGAVATDLAPTPGLRTVRIVDRLMSPYDVLDTEGHLARAYGACARTLVLIRPDGYIALISDAGRQDLVRSYLVEWSPAALA